MFFVLTTLDLLPLAWGILASIAHFNASLIHSLWIKLWIKF